MSAEKQKMELEIADMVVSTYNKIAIWNNSDFDSPKQKGDALKVISQDIVQSVLEQLMNNLGASSGVDVFRGDVKVSNREEVKDGESFSNSDESDIFNRLFINKEKPE